MPESYFDKLINDMPDQFKNRSGITVLMQAFADQLQQVYDFFEELNINRRIDTAVGVQLDRIGDIVCLTRAQAGLLTGDPIPVDILNDATYRIYLKYKVLLNTSDCSYKDLISGLSMFFTDAIYYKEDLSRPACIVFRVSSDIAAQLATMPIVRAAGVGLHIEVYDCETTYDMVPYFATFIDDFFRFVWTQDETQTHVEGESLVLGEFSSSVVGTTLIPPGSTTVIGEIVVFE